MSIRPRKKFRYCCQKLYLSDGENGENCFILFRHFLRGKHILSPGSWHNTKPYLLSRTFDQRKGNTVTACLLRLLGIMLSHIFDCRNIQLFTRLLVDNKRVIIRFGEQPSQLTNKAIGEKGVMTTPLISLLPQKKGEWHFINWPACAEGKISIILDWICATFSLWRNWTSSLPLDGLVDGDNQISISISKSSEKIGRTFILFLPAHLIENYIIKYTGCYPFPRLSSQ